MAEMADFRASRGVLLQRIGGGSLSIRWSVKQRRVPAVQLQLGLAKVRQVVKVIGLDLALGQKEDARHQLRRRNRRPLAALEGADVRLGAAEKPRQLFLGDFPVSTPDRQPHRSLPLTISKRRYCADLYFLARYKKVTGHEYNHPPYNVVVMRPGNRLRELRKKAQLTQIELADRTGVSQSAISQIENGDVSMTIQWMRAFARALGCAPADLLDADDNPDRLEADERDLVQRYRSASEPLRETLTRVAAAVVPYRGETDDERAA